jgi:hyperosmotically inducible protein
MNSPNKLAKCVPALAIGLLAGCSTGSTNSPDVVEAVQKNLDQAHLSDVGVSQDRDKGVVTLNGHVASEADKTQAETIAKSVAPGQVIADEIAVIPPGAGSDAKTVNADLDKGIEDNVTAALVQAHLKKGIDFDVKNGVVKLTGEVNSEAKRVKVESIASQVPNVKQVVNEVEVKGRKATSTKQ